MRTRLAAAEKYDARRFYVRENCECVYNDNTETANISEYNRRIKFVEMCTCSPIKKNQLFLSAKERHFNELCDN
jgi:hypothetical protein